MRAVHEALPFDVVPQFSPRPDVRRGERNINPRPSIRASKFRPSFLAMAPGTEVPAIWRYLEETYPGHPLLGRDATSKALVTMRKRRVEPDGFAPTMEGRAPAFCEPCQARASSVRIAPRRSCRMRPPCRSARQDDFAEWPILDQMTQGLARFAEGIDPLDNWLDRTAHDQRDDVPPRIGDSGR